MRCDVSREADIQALVRQARERFGRVDIYFSNAGILGRMGGIELEDALWDKMWQVHGMAHVWAARAVVPEMVERGEGYFLVTASAAGLLNIVEIRALRRDQARRRGDRRVAAHRLWPQGRARVLPVPAVGADGHDRATAPARPASTAC